MQTVETLNEGLKRAYTVTIPAAEVTSRVDAEIKAVAPKVSMPGFRAGKVPANLVRKMHGAAIHADVLNKLVQDSVQQLMAEQALRPAMSPSVELNESYAEGLDVELKVALEVLPVVETVDIDGLKLERLTVASDDTALDATLAQLAGQQKRYEAAPEGHAAALGDLVVIDFLGKVDGEPFDGGKGEKMSVVLGEGRLIPGFEDQIIGATAGEARVLHVTFPEDYNVAYLAGRDATFDITVHEVQLAHVPKVDDAFASALGIESLDKLKDLLRGNVEQEHNTLTRTYMKRKLLDALAERHSFECPPSMVDAEFNQIWQQLEREVENEPDPAAARAEMEADREDYRRIAERRVRLGLLLSEIGQRQGIEITANEMNMLIAQAAREYDAKDRERFVDYIRNEPMAAAQLRAPMYEDKVVDYLFSIAEISERSVTKDELEAAIESEDGHVHGPDCGHDHHDHDHHDHDAPKAEAGVETKAKKASRAAKPAEAAPEATVAEGADPEAAKPAKKPAAKKAAKADVSAEAPADGAEPKPAKKAAKPKAPAAE